jgi:4-nitrophenyl phosphatase
MGNPDNNIKGLILDMDGVLWKGDQTIGNLPKIFSMIHEKGIRVTLATNNATRDVDQYILRMKDYGVSLEDWQVVNSGMAVAHVLKRFLPQGGPVFIMGEHGLINVLKAEGFYHSADAPKAVIVGMERDVTYEKLSTVTLFIRSGLPFIGTNPDRTFPTPRGLIPGCGAFLALLEAATDVRPIIAGKPEADLYNLALERLETKREQTLVVGDRLDTDILGGYRAGFPTALVLSGVSTLQDVEKFSPKPDRIVPDLQSLVESL